MGTKYSYGISTDGSGDSSMNTVMKLLIRLKQ